jgi:hypothetical protein
VVQPECKAKFRLTIHPFYASEFAQAFFCGGGEWVGGASKTVGYSKRIETFMTVQIIRIILYSNFQPHEAMFKAPLPPWERGLG